MPERGGGVVGERRVEPQQAAEAAEATTGKSLGQDAQLVARGEDQDRRGGEQAREVAGGRRAHFRGSLENIRIRGEKRETSHESAELMSVA